MVAMASDIRVISSRSRPSPQHGARWAPCPSRSRSTKAKEERWTLRPIANRLGIHAIKWEWRTGLRHAAPRKYQEIKKPGDQAARGAGATTSQAGSPAQGAQQPRDRGEISGRAKHSIPYTRRMQQRRAREFQRDLDPHGMRAESIMGRRRQEQEGGSGVIHSLMEACRPRSRTSSRCPSQHVPVAAHDGDRTRGARWRSKSRTGECTTCPSTASPRMDLQGRRRRSGPGARGEERRPEWLRRRLDWPEGARGPPASSPTVEGSRCSRDEEFVFQPKGPRFKSLAAGPPSWTSLPRSHPTSDRCVAPRSTEDGDALLNKHPGLATSSRSEHPSASAAP